MSLMKNKIYVYAISKNEEKFVDRWMNSLEAADAVYVLDTGSTDNTVQKLKDRGAIVKVKEIKPWRFDVARNESLKMVPEDADICICLDLDEVIEDGWRQKLEEIWNENITRLRYNYNWSFDEYGNPAVNFYSEKIHKKNGYKWTHPVHEILSYDGTENFITTDEITVNHYPDSTKSRGSYLPLLELSVEEDPTDDRNMHYLGREYMYHEMYEKCIDTLIKHLNLESATWKDERSASMRFIARSYRNLGRLDEARLWLEKAKNETPYLREPYVESAILEYNNDNFEEADKNLSIALNIKGKYKNYINEPFCYDSTIYDLLSICKFNENKLAEAIYYLDIAIEMDPDDERLKNNKKIIENALNSVN